MQRLALTLSLVLSVAGNVACSSDGGDDGGEETGGSGGSATGGTSGSSTGGSTTGGSSGASTGGSTTGGSTTGGSGGAGVTGGTGGSGGAAFTKRGSCGHKSTLNAVTTTTYSDTTEEYFTISEEALAEGLLDQYICLIRVNVTRVGEGPANCVDLEGVACEWTHKVAISDPEVIMNIDGACDKNEAGWNAAWMAALDGSQASYGYVDMYQGHDSVVMTATGAPGAETWGVLGRASWNPDSGDFSFDTRDPCRY